MLYYIINCPKCNGEIKILDYNYYTKDIILCESCLTYFNYEYDECCDENHEDCYDCPKLIEIQSKKSNIL